MFPTTVEVDMFPITHVSNSIATTHVETVVLLSTQKAKRYVDIEITTDELDLT